MEVTSNTGNVEQTDWSGLGASDWCFEESGDTMTIKYNSLKLINTVSVKLNFVRYQILCKSM